VATIDELVERIRQTPNCHVHPPAGLPTVRPGTDDRLPDDLVRFYTLCGGARLFEGTYAFSIVDPAGVVQVDLDRLGKVYETDISASWYVVATSSQAILDALSIDLSEERLGRCYLSFFEYHRHKGDCPIVATSFGDLLERLLDEGGRYFHWWEKDFESLGDAYDGYEERWLDEEDDDEPGLP
jgi:antitoxin YokJ